MMLLRMIESCYPAVLRVYLSASMITVMEGDGHVEICANMVDLSERPVDLLLTTSDFTAHGESISPDPPLSCHMTLL